MQSLQSPSQRATAVTEETTLPWLNKRFQPSQQSQYQQNTNKCEKTQTQQPSLQFNTIYSEASNVTNTFYPPLPDFTQLKFIFIFVFFLCLLFHFIFLGSVIVCFEKKNTKT